MLLQCLWVPVAGAVIREIKHHSSSQRQWEARPTCTVSRPPKNSRVLACVVASLRQWRLQGLRQAPQATLHLVEPELLVSQPYAAFEVKPTKRCGLAVAAEAGQWPPRAGKGVNKGASRKGGSRMGMQNHSMPSLRTSDILLNILPAT